MLTESPCIRIAPTVPAPTAGAGTEPPRLAIPAKSVHDPPNATRDCADSYRISQETFRIHRAGSSPGDAGSGATSNASWAELLADIRSRTARCRGKPAGSGQRRNPGIVLSQNGPGH